MKKLFIAGAVAMALAGGLAGCSKSAEEADSFKVSKGLTDSIATYYGLAYGQNIWNYIDQQQQRTGDTINKADVIKGVQYILAGESSSDISLGMQIGLDIKRFIDDSRKNGMEVTPSDVMKYFRQAVLADTISQGQAQADYATFNMLMSRVRELENARKRQEIDKVAEENTKAGEEFIAQAKANDPSIQTSKSGLSYKIENPGEGDRIGASDRATVKYTGRLVNGEQFDAGTAEFAPSRVVPGFGEGMQLLGKGGKATLYIPGSLGYGQQGAGDKIGPNATLIFDIEIIDVTPAQSAE